MNQDLDDRDASDKGSNHQFNDSDDENNMPMSARSLITFTDDIPHYIKKH